MTGRLTIMGMGTGPKDLTRAHKKILENADVIIGGSRHLAHAHAFKGEKRQINKNLKDIVRHIKDHMHQKKIVVLASGDPLFFGIGSYLVKQLGKDQVTLLPNVSSVASAFARIKESWNDAAIVSLHGRDKMPQLISAAEKYDKIAVYTDPERNPARIAHVLMQNNMPDFNMCVLEKMGTVDETVTWLDLESASKKPFKDPNMVILKKTSAAKDKKAIHHMGMPESAFLHENNLITKAEVRAVTLSKLRLFPDAVMWDLGAGSGSVSVEAGLFITRGQIHAVEKNQDRIAHIQANKNRFNVHNMAITCARLPEAIEDLPEPDRVFIGGGGRHLDAIIKAAGQKLKPGGIMVVNTVLTENIRVAQKSMEDLGFKTRMIQMQVNKSKAMPFGRRMEAENPVWIISGIKK